MEDDLGFMIGDSFGKAWELTGEKSYFDVVRQASETLCTRFNPNVGAIRSWDHNRDKWKYPVITSIFVIDENGAVFNPDASGAYLFVWKNAQKGVKNVYVKSLPGGATGTVTLQTSDTAGETPVNNDLSTTLQSKTADYEVRIFSQNYKVAINIK